MEQLLRRYELTPTAVLAAKVAAHDRRHPMAACMLDERYSMLLRLVLAHAAVQS